MVKMVAAPARHDSGRYSPDYANGNAARSLSPQQQQQQEHEQEHEQEQRYHRRGYQACDPCRKRKVKCDLGSMFQSHGQSERKEGYRKKGKTYKRFAQASITHVPHPASDAVAKANDANSRLPDASASRRRLRRW